jgi:hypothetical protein
MYAALNGADRHQAPEVIAETASFRAPWTIPESDAVTGAGYCKRPEVGVR